MTRSQLAAVAAGVCPVCRRDSCDDESHVRAARRLISFSADGLQRHRFPTRRTILERAGGAVLRQGDLAQVHAERGIGKTWLLQTFSLIAAAGASALGFSAPQSVRVLRVDGEMAAEELQSRDTELCHRLGIDPPPTLTIVAADWQTTFLPRLDTEAGQTAIDPFIEHADLIVLDNRSCLFDPEGEKDPTAWQATQAWLLSLRRRGKAVLMAHHSNRMGGARGHSKAEDALNLIIKLARPDDYQADEGARFVATFEKSRGVHGAAVAPFAAHLTSTGWIVDDQHAPKSTATRLLEHVRLSAAAGERVKSATAAIRGAGVQKSAGLEAWAQLLERGAVAKHPDGGFRVA